MATPNQEILTYPGDAERRRFQVVDANGAPIDISDAAEILFVAEDCNRAQVLNKRLTLNGVIFDTDGTDGWAVLLIETGETSALIGDYSMWTLLTDANGNDETVVTGVMTVQQR